MELVQFVGVFQRGFGPAFYLAVSLQPSAVRLINLGIFITLEIELVSEYLLEYCIAFTFGNYQVAETSPPFRQKHPPGPITCCKTVVSNSLTLLKSPL